MYRFIGKYWFNNTRDMKLWNLLNLPKNKKFKKFKTIFVSKNTEQFINKWRNYFNSYYSHILTDITLTFIKRLKKYFKNRIPCDSCSSVCSDRKRQHNNVFLLCSRIKKRSLEKNMSLFFLEITSGLHFQAPEVRSEVYRWVNAGKFIKIGALYVKENLKKNNERHCKTGTITLSATLKI